MKINGIISIFTSTHKIMKILVALFALSLNITLHAAPRFITGTPAQQTQWVTDPMALCKTARETLAYLNRGQGYDPLVIHNGKTLQIPLFRVKATLAFICQNQQRMQDSHFIQQHFDFVRWYPDVKQAHDPKLHKPLAARLPEDKILMTKYYVHLAKAASQKSPDYPFPIYGLPQDEAHLTLEAADKIPGLTRFKFGKQAILAGALENQHVPALAWLSREDLEAALLQGTLVAQFTDRNGAVKTFNVHRNNGIAYNKAQPPYQQERYWYFRAVEGIKGYGKDADHKITVENKATFAGDLQQFGLGKLLLVQYRDRNGQSISRIGVMADTGGAFDNNQYQVDFLAGSFQGRTAFSQGTRDLPDYVDAYFMILKDSYAQ